ncbi:MAG: class I SAM-dependent methyltransferase [Acidobacteriota bacterium]
MAELYNTHYGEFAAEVQRAVRSETYGEDVGQSSWMTADELLYFATILKIDSSSNVLEIGSGSGGSAIFLAENTGCAITGIDANEFGISNANELAKQRGLDSRARFEVIDASKRLAFDAGEFDVVFSNDVMCHVPDRQKVLQEWHRVLKPAGQMLFTDALVITGIISHIEIAKRSSIGLYFFVPTGENERMIDEAGFEIIAVEDLTPAAAEVSKRWYDARAKHRAGMFEIEGEENFEGLQDFLQCVHTLTSEKRLSRFMYHARKV